MNDPRNHLLRTLLSATVVIVMGASPAAIAAPGDAHPHAPHARVRVHVPRHHRAHRRSAHRSRQARTAGKRTHAGHTRRAQHHNTHGSSSAAATIASLLATPCQNSELTPEPGNLEAIDAATLCLVNQERARNGELPLQPNAQLEQAAQGHSEEMVSEDYFAHVAPSGLTPVARVQETGYLPNPQAGYTLGENIAWGTLGLSTPSAIVAAWIASPEHLANILYSPYRDTGIGVAPEAPASLAEGQPGAVYSQEFGVIVE